MPITDAIDSEQFPNLATFSAPVVVAERKIVGRDQEIVSLLAAMHRPELCNVLLLGPAGSGKTALVQAASLADTKRSYREVNLAGMIQACKAIEDLGGMLKNLFDEAESYAVDGDELVLFIDEIHQVVMLSPSAVEALKPVLAASGARGLRIITATTYDEFHEHMASNLPLVERLQRINLSEPDRQTTVEILKGMAVRYEVAEQFYNDQIFEVIYEYTQRYMPMSSQPRKSILVLDAMVGWHRQTSRPMDMRLLADVMRESANVNVTFRVDATRIKQELDRVVFAQTTATALVSDRLQICVADLQDKTKPMASFLFAGSTGVGKGTLVNEDIPVFDPTGSVAWKKAGDLVPGDQTFTREGTPQKVLGVFPQPVQDVYEVTLSDGRSLVTDGPHLWGVYPSLRDRSRGLTVLSTETLALRLAEAGSRETRKLRYSIPMNQPVQWPEADLPVAPYALGALIADGALTVSVQPLVLSSDDEFIVAKVAEQIGAVGYDRLRKTHGRKDESFFSNYNWYFRSGKKARRGVARVAKKDIIGDIPELMNVYSPQRRVPKRYLTASVEQRWELVRGLFDSDGHIGGKDGGRFNISYSTSSEGLAEDVRHLLYSLGVIANISFSDRHNGTSAKPSREYSVHVRSQQADKHRFFSLPRKLEIAARAAEVEQVKPFDTDYVDIVSVTKLDRQEETVCIYVDHPEHLYQAGRDFVVTHNTELTKQLSNLLFGDGDRHFLRMDMSEYSQASAVDRFRDTLTQMIWNSPYAVLLLDEIEKADKEITKLLLQVLDDGKMSNKDGREVPFINSYIVLTTNAAADIFQSIGQYSEDSAGSDKAMKENRSLIRKAIGNVSGGKFPVELLGRIDEIIPFVPLDRPTQRKIVISKLGKIRREVMLKHRVALKVSDKVIDYLIEDRGETDASLGGARGAISLMTSEVVAPLATFINAHPNERSVRVDVVGDLVSDNKEKRTTDAYVSVTAAD